MKIQLARRLTMPVYAGALVWGTMHDGAGEVGDTPPDKCGLRTSFEVVRLWESLGPLEKARAQELLTPSQMQTDTVIGRFRVHFDTTNVSGNEPALLDGSGQRIPGTARMYVDSVGFYFNRVWNVEIDSLGYGAPPFEAGDMFYNVYVRNLGSGLYGQTVIFPQQPINPGQTPPRYTTYIDIHKDFQPFFSRGIEGLKVTAAHEFHHAVQVGSYGFRPNDLYFYEITSTWMEDVVFDNVNDYYQYIRSPSGVPRGHFDTPQRSFNVSNGFVEYSRAIWGKFVEKRFGRSVMRRAWETMRQQPSLAAINAGLQEVQSSMREAYAEFFVWNYFTGTRADTFRFYAEASNYPGTRIRDTLQFQQPISAFSDTGVQGLGGVYYRVDLGPGPADTVISIVMETNVADAGNGESERFQYMLRSDGGDAESYRMFVAGGRTFWVRVSGVRNFADWTLIQLSDTSILKSGRQEVVVYPNPFYIPENGWVRFQPPAGTPSPAALYIFSSSIALIHSAERDLQGSLLATPYFLWDGRSDDGGLAASGVYFYVLRAGGNEYRGKFSIVRK